MDIAADHAGFGSVLMELEYFCNALAELPNPVREFSPGAWGALVEYVTVTRDGEIKITFKNGQTI